MKTKRVLRYYCDHCHKGGCGKSAMMKHEERCIRNPNRKCGFCALEGLEQKSVRELMAIWGKEGLGAMKEAANNCPACILSAIVQSRCWESDGEGPGQWVDFDYKKAVQEFWNERNSREREKEDAFNTAMVQQFGSL